MFEFKAARQQLGQFLNPKMEFVDKTEFGGLRESESHPIWINFDPYDWQRTSEYLFVRFVWNTKFIPEQEKLSLRDWKMLTIRLIKQCVLSRTAARWVINLVWKMLQSFNIFGYPSHQAVEQDKYCSGCTAPKSQVAVNIVISINENSLFDLPEWMHGQ